MTEPTTVNVGLIIPNTGDLPGTWSTGALNPDFVAIDGYHGGIQIISVSNAPITLTSPAGFTPTPGGGPTQAQNAVLRFTGALTANVQVTLPLPGPISIENLTTGAFVLSFRAIGSGQVIAIDQGRIQTIYNDGTNVRFVNLSGEIGETKIWAGRSAMPAWVTACTVPPYLLCDGTIYNASTYPYLFAILGGQFGGNGISTFGVPDLRGRVPLPYDGTGTRITTGGCGLNGQTIGAALDEQTVTLERSDLPNVSPTFTGTQQTWSLNSASARVWFAEAGTTLLGSGNFSANSLDSSSLNVTVTPAGTVQSLNGGVTQTNVANVPPSQVTGIAVIRAA